MVGTFERNSRRFLGCWLFLLFYLTEGFLFIAFRRHPSPFCGLSPGLHPFYTFGPASRRVIHDTFILAFLGFSFYRECYGFERAFFTYRLFLPCSPSRHFGTFYDSDASRNTPSRNSFISLLS